MENLLSRWASHIGDGERATYAAIADAIAEDIQSGYLRGDQKLPPLRHVANGLGINFTTASRGYREAAERGLIVSRPGSGSFVRGEIPWEPIRRSSPLGTMDMSMNMPPEPADERLREQLRSGLGSLAQEPDLYGLLRYQEFGGTERDRQAAALWMSNRLPDVDPSNILICPGAHAGLLGLFAALAGAGDTIACEAVAYPGIKGIAAHLGIRLAGLRMDGHGLDPDAFAAFCAANPPKALYVNPTVQNPTTATVPMERRRAIADIARRYGVPIIEDDPYACLPRERLPPIATLAPELTFYVAGLAKVLGAGLRIGYIVLPNVRYTARLTTTLASLVVMANPAMIRLATYWVEDETIRASTRAIREESEARQAMASTVLADIDYQADPQGFHLWLPVPSPWTRVDLITRLRPFKLLAVAADTFTVRGPAPEAVRVCLGGATTRDECYRHLEIIRDAIEHLPGLAANAG